MAVGNRRKEQLDALRGLAALGFALGSWLSYSIWADIRAVGNLSLLADFVLVVAGFVVARAHRDQLTASRRVGRYLFARIGRLFPLHAACLAAFLAVDFMIIAAYGDPRAGGVADFLATLSLIHVFLDGAVVWNAPSWIIAVELHMSVLFAGLCMLGMMTRPLGRAAALILVGVALYARLSPSVAVSPVADLLLRGWVAYMLGAMLFSFVAIERVRKFMRRLKKKRGALFEAMALIQIPIFVIYAPAWLAPAAPIVCWFCLLVFVRRTSSVASLLSNSATQRLGDLSYAILLTHSLLIHPAAGLAASLGPDAAAAAVTVGTPIYLIALIVLAEVALRLVETPTRKAMWTWADRAFPPAGAPEPEAAAESPPPPRRTGRRRAQG
ncbi:MAG: acyltransferase [Pseudomonadota bacterium]